MKRWGKLNYAQKTCVARAGMLMQQTQMLSPGARIGVAVSGGVDSFVMIQTLLIRKSIVPFPIEPMVFHINPGFDGTNHMPVADWCQDNGLAAHFEVTNFGPRAFSEENREKSACFFCSMHRRRRLFELCRNYNVTHLALGHTKDDLVTTFFMNMMQGGKVDGLHSRDEYFGGELMLIRPMLLIEKDMIRRAAKAWRLPIVTNPCPASENSRRSQIGGWLSELWSHSPEIKRNMHNAIGKWQLDLDKSLS
jgi:tRNA(Ile)-lysidine synthase TilS/MesJ